MKITLPKLNYAHIMGWLFMLSIPAIPIAWLFFSHTALLWAIVFFALMTAYQVLEFFYDEHRERRKAKLEALQIESVSQIRSDNTRLRRELDFLRKQLHELHSAPLFKTARFKELISRIDIALNDSSND